MTSSSSLASLYTEILGMPGIALCSQVPTRFLSAPVPAMRTLDPQRSGSPSRAAAPPSVFQRLGTRSPPPHHSARLQLTRHHSFASVCWGLRPPPARDQDPALRNWEGWPHSSWTAVRPVSRWRRASASAAVPPACGLATRARPPAPLRSSTRRAADTAGRISADHLATRNARRVARHEPAPHLTERSRVRYRVMRVSDGASPRVVMEPSQRMRARPKAFRQRGAREDQRVHMRSSLAGESLAPADRQLSDMPLKDRAIETSAVVRSPHERPRPIECLLQPPFALRPRLTKRHCAMLLQLSLRPAMDGAGATVDLAIRVAQPAELGILA
eukprot:CAMPEP_0181171070 /NCGR_PEP_ID=MMETSP1096-20121128/1706_1 /TAXON_ID=156174 ORGANISM="Chrysochromulina ericina, Strain CCMP281" /NCGR_SAMPLE_ID=MMETSP1096 /ASSEMBLY_ACC=CAM_ASM_000453 /LENGTH=328 /DNA_ID=CAMNT_0023258679 /DNA_START=442 /DNA_END=1429 /DNA_ORIENTATION=-